MVLEQNVVPLDQKTDIGTTSSVPEENISLTSYDLEIGTGPSMSE